ncbi:hypothetical protein Taro_014416 [Colocasia esculenta]|uniref:Uncharacterized protein n=1 Tax=Colocasia esculenta TaxID=4460 RepID=A0A843UQ29_COLES|nr:hypothetical protein [Colocasia esculenta]
MTNMMGTARRRPTYKKAPMGLICYVEGRVTFPPLHEAFKAIISVKRRGTSSTSRVNQQRRGDRLKYLDDHLGQYGHFRCLGPTRPNNIRSGSVPL